MRILVGTGDGLHEFADGGRAGPVHHAGRNVTALAPGPDYSELWAILDEAEVWRTAGPRGSRRSTATRTFIGCGRSTDGCSRRAPAGWRSARIAGDRGRSGPRASTPCTAGASL